VRIAIATDDGKHVAGHTGRCRGFAVYDVEGDAVTPREYRENTFTHHQRVGPSGEHDHHAAAHSHAPLIQALDDCSVLISRGMGPRLLADLSARGIDAFICDADGVEQSARDFAAGRLQRLDGGGCCHH